jgi:hypothetical protein
MFYGIKLFFMIKEKTVTWLNDHIEVFLNEIPILMNVRSLYL